MSVPFEQRLDDFRASPLLKDFLTKYQHIERMGHEEVDGLLNGQVLIQTKLDGANLSVAWHPDQGMVVASRNMVVSLGGRPDHGFNGAVEYCLTHRGLTSLFAVHPMWVVRGEWCVRHSINYGKEHYQHLYVFDIEEQGRYVHPDVWGPLLDNFGIRRIKTLAVFDSPTLDQLTPYTDGPDEFGAQAKEGIVIKNYAFVNKFGRTQWGKLVTADFKTANKLAFGAHKSDAYELQFAANTVTVAGVLKTIHKMRDEKARGITVRDMAELLGRVYYDCFQEELWDFVKKNRVRAFNFHEARRLAEQKTREIALAYFNGTLTLGTGIGNDTT